MKIKTFVLTLLASTLPILASAGDKDITVNLGDGEKLELVWVDGGSFMMGSKANEPTAHLKDKPAHKVTVSGFYIGKYEVTRSQWIKVMGRDYFINSGADNGPAVGINFRVAMEFIEELNKQTGKRFRLPTEAEWEYAARGGNRSRGYKYSGSNILNNVATPKITSVGTKAPNELGIYDMSGNAAELCHDWYGSFSTAPAVNPKGTFAGIKKVVKGGFIGSPWSESRTTPTENDYRVYSRSSCNTSNGGYPTMGLRLVLPVTEDPYDITPFYATDMKMQYVKGGTFRMGTEEDTEWYAVDEVCYVKNWPMHTVTVSSFYICCNEVTNSQWKAIMGYVPSDITYSDYPVTNVSWNEVQTFIRKLREATGINYRLPTEAEWEYASKSKYTWKKKSSNHKQLHDVQSLGIDVTIMDMMENVTEWCEDWVGPYSSRAQVNPKGAASNANNEKIARGNSFSELTLFTLTNVFTRYRLNADKRYKYVGFRLVVSAK